MKPLIGGRATLPSASHCFLHCLGRGCVGSGDGEAGGILQEGSGARRHQAVTWYAELCAQARVVSNDSTFYFNGVYGSDKGLCLIMLTGMKCAGTHSM